MVSGTALSKAVSSCVPIRLEFVPEQRGSFAPVGAGKTQKLARDKVSGMGRNEIEKTRFVFGVPEGLERVDLGSRDIHRERILAVISLSSRTRRRREASSRRA